MQCPKCGIDNADSEMYCKECGSPLGNTSYRQIPKKSKKKILAIIIPLVLIALIIGGIFGYRFIVANGCEKATNMIFEHARTLDFSDVDKRYLPDALKENPNIRESVEEALKEELKSTPIGNLVPVDDLDLGPIVDEITKDATYEITDKKVSWNKCVVSIHTENTDFSQIPDTLSNLIKQDAMDKDSELWKAISQQIGNLFNQNDGSSESPDWAALIMYYYNTAKKSAPRIEKEGQITYGFDGWDITGWTIKDYDKDLIRGFYGIEIPDTLLNKYLPDMGDESESSTEEASTSKKDSTTAKPKESTTSIPTTAVTNQ